MQTKRHFGWRYGPALGLAWMLSCGAAPQVEPGSPQATAGVLPPADQPAPAANAAPAPAPPPSAPAKRSAAELEKLAQPIALHPDPLIAIILPAAVYPVEIVQAARFVRDTNNIPQVDQQPWDANVKAVAKFPDLVAKMDADLSWTVALGQAFLDQPKELMDTIQDLRAKAQKAGTLRTTEQQVVTVTNVVVIETNVTQVVTVTNQVVQVQPANPQVIYVPTYPPTVYYPPPTYVYDPYAPLVTFGVGLAVGAIIANNCDWHGGGIYVGGGGMVVWGGGGYHGDVDIDIDQDINIDRGERPTPRNGERAGTTGARPTQQKWQPDQNRLRTSGAAAPSAGTMEARGWQSRSARGATQPAAGARPAPATGAVGARPSAGVASPRPATGGPAVSRPAPAPARPSPGVSRPAPSPQVSRPAPAPASRGTAFSGVNSGSNARSYSNRGSVSRGPVSRGGGGGFRGGGGRR